MSDASIPPESDRLVDPITDPSEFDPDNAPVDATPSTEPEGVAPSDDERAVELDDAGYDASGGSADGGESGQDDGR